MAQATIIGKLPERILNLLYGKEFATFIKN